VAAVKSGVGAEVVDVGSAGRVGATAGTRPRAATVPAADTVYTHTHTHTHTANCNCKERYVRPFAPLIEQPIATVLAVVYHICSGNIGGSTIF